MSVAVAASLSSALAGAVGSIGATGASAAATAAASAAAIGAAKTAAASAAGAVPAVDVSDIDGSIVAGESVDGRILGLEGRGLEDCCLDIDSFGGGGSVGYMPEHVVRVNKTDESYGNSGHRVVNLNNERRRTSKPKMTRPPGTDKS